MSDNNEGCIKSNSEDSTEIKKEKKDMLNTFVFHPNFKQTISDINALKIKLPFPTNQNLDYDGYSFPSNGELTTNIENIKQYNLNPKNGFNLIKEKYPIAAYDESINKYATLQGEAYLTSHSMILLGERDYVPLNFLTLYFYTRAKAITNDQCQIRYSNTPQVESQKDYIVDKLDFLEKFSPQNTILLIDGPLIGGDVYTYMIHAIDKFLDKNIIPIFFVKNSTSNIVTNHIDDFKNKFNSDMHWSYSFLNQGERTNFFKYADRHNKKNAKIFCYLKPFNLSPQRIEMHVDTYKKYENQIPVIMDLIYYLILEQGSKKNPQVRPIAIAEAYAREALKLININKLMKRSGLIPTINQERFAW